MQAAFGKRLVSVTLASILFLAMPVVSAGQKAKPQTNEANKQQVLSGIADNWIEIGKEQYTRGYYKAAEQSFISAQGYQEYLTAAGQEKIKEYLEKIPIAMRRRKGVLEAIQRANGLIEQGQLIKAKAHLKNIKDNESLTEKEQKQIQEALRKIDSQLDEKKKEIAELYNRSVKFYFAGELKKACDGFIKVASSGLHKGQPGKTAEDYLMRINSALAKRVESLTSARLKRVEKRPEAVVAPAGDKVANVAKSAGLNKPHKTLDATKRRHVKVVDRKTRILQSYVKALVNDAAAKVQNYVGQGQFDKAKGVVKTAERIVRKKRQGLGDKLFRRYSSKLEKLFEQIEAEKARWHNNWNNRSAWKL